MNVINIIFMIDLIDNKTDKVLKEKYNKKGMHRWIILLFLIYTSYCKVQIPALGLTYMSAQITPTGQYWQKFEPVDGVIMLVDAQIPCEAYKGLIAFAIVEPYMDDKILYLKECGAKAVLILGVNTVYPGNAIRFFRNGEPFTDEKELYPVTELRPSDGAELANYFVNITVASQFTQFIYVIMDAEEGNVWKDHAYSPGMYSQQFILGPTCILVIVWSIINIYRLVKKDIPHPKVPYILCALLIIGNIFRLIGFVDFQGWKQIMDFKAAIFFSYAGIGFVFSASWFMTLLMLNTVDRSNIKVTLIMKRYLWPYIVISVILVANDWINSQALYITLTSYADIISVAIVWSTVSAGIYLALGIIFVVAFGKVYYARKRSLALQSNQSKDDRILIITTTINLVIGVSIILYALISLITWADLAGYPDREILFYFIQPLLLSIVAIAITVNVHLRIQQYVESASSTKNSKGSSANDGSSNKPQSGLAMSN
ncbi:Transmembrane domain-containing protein [Orpheovirus IHUMI-LCC2]|uniref:Transmembrane domain-containing protein n=1 Tax=Orpheovirus IHUMI-LCC2 TaxID=2023057 RepID=A0A2I2L456_9VIRU|nr:Transmembrane domain-containing protein [Orpheovirus IHUMI-LCC2]SNW62313.1 Transmembrane domain-containing protein [Orpheovirus IHUMI-LCC2]